MDFDFSALAPQVHQILSAPGTDLTTISAKSVRKALLQMNPDLTPDFFKENKPKVDSIIRTVFEEFNDTGDAEEKGDVAESSSRRHSDEDDADAAEDEDEKPPSRVKKAKKNNDTSDDAELARKLSSEINGRSRRSTGAPSKAKRANGKKKKAKSAEEVDSGDDSADAGGAKRKKRSGGAKGGFAKEFYLRFILSFFTKLRLS